MKRTRTRKRVDRKVFRNTSGTKRINVSPAPMRGGIRL